jgi:putative flippase GtrA
MQFIKLLYTKFRTLILYGMIGCFSSFIDFIIFTTLVKYATIYYMYANCISVLVGISLSFFLNRLYNFKVKDKVVRRFLIFLSVGLCGLLFSNLILWIGIDKMHGDETITKLASIAMVVFFQFLLNKFVTFKKYKS